MKRRRSSHSQAIMEPFTWTTRHEDSPESPRRDERTQVREPRAEPRSRRGERTPPIRDFPRRDEPMLSRKRDRRRAERAHFRERRRSREREQGYQCTKSPERPPPPPRDSGDLGQGLARRAEPNRRTVTPLHIRAPPPPPPPQRRRLAAARMLVPYQGCLRPTAVQRLPAARGLRWLHSIRGSSLAT